MSQNPYQAPQAFSAAQAGVSERADFIMKTYAHLSVAVGAFVLLEVMLFNLLDAESLTRLMMGSRISWLVVLGLFMGVSWIANSWAQNTTSLSTQYMGLALYVVAEAIIFVPLLFIASRIPSVIPTAGVATLFLFASLSAVVYITRTDFSFLRSALIFGGFAALGFIVCGLLFGFNFGMIFTVAMIVLACGYILFDTSQIMLHYRTDQYVAASLALFASVALLFWYIIQLVMSLSRD